MAVVMLKGMLYGVGSESACEILAWRVDGSPVKAYSQMRVVDAPLDLPDGAYTLVVDSRVYSTEKHEGSWRMVLVEKATA